MGHTTSKELEDAASTGIPLQVFPKNKRVV